MQTQVESTKDSIEAVTVHDSHVDQETKPAPKVSSEALDEKIEASEALEENNEVDEAETEDDSAEQGEKTSEKKPDKINGVQKKINKLTKRASEAEREKEYWKQEALKKSQPQAKDEAKSNNSVVDKKVEGKPKAEDFEKHEEFVEALTDWKLEQRSVKEKTDKLNAENQKEIDVFQSKISDLKKVHDDFDEAIESVEDIPMSLAVQSECMKSPELMYALAKRRDEYKKICELPYNDALKALGRFEDKYLSKEKQETKPTTTKAPTPISTVGTRSSSAVKKTIFDEDLSQGDYEKLRARQMKGI